MNKKRQHYIPLWDEGTWNKVCADADAYWEAKRQRRKRMRGGEHEQERSRKR